MKAMTVVFILATTNFLYTSAAPYSTAPIVCRTEYTTLWSTEYIEVEEKVCRTVYVDNCSTQYKKKCRDVPKETCDTIHEHKCNTVFNEVCVQKVRTEYTNYTETECTTQYKQDCEYQWEEQDGAKVWVAIPATCQSNPHDICEHVDKQRERQVPYNDCSKVPQHTCEDVPRKSCRTVQVEECEERPYEHCSTTPKEECDVVHQKIPDRVSKKFAKKVCDDNTSGSNLDLAKRTSTESVPAQVAPNTKHTSEYDETNLIATRVSDSDSIVFE